MAATLTHELVQAGEYRTAFWFDMRENLLRQLSRMDFIASGSDKSLTDRLLEDQTLLVFDGLDVFDKPPMLRGPEGVIYGSLSRGRPNRHVLYVGRDLHEPTVELTDLTAADLAMHTMWERYESQPLAA